MQIFFASLKSAAGLIWPIVKKRWPLLLTLHVLAFSSGQLMDHWQDQTLASGREDWMALIPLFITSGLLEIILASAWLIAVAAREPGFSSLTRFLNATLIETVRALASVLRWSPALIIPGLVKYLRYMLVPFVVVTDERYERGELDALQEAQVLSRGRLGLLLAALAFETLFTLGVGRLVHGGNDSVFTNAVPTLVWGVFAFFINLFTTLFLFSIYQNLVKVPVERNQRKKQNVDVPMERSPQP